MAVVTLSDGTNQQLAPSTAVTYDTINPTPITTNPMDFKRYSSRTTCFLRQAMLSA
ncbi:MAG: hypothetical protein H0A76_05865 [Candidatus Thiodubiliella endoseptemdiera]|uniref:Uncharacterized protein n=1 Tax=Candidatus Thiodubiliella endoseptemdiera TaxID=2738886 RepID=A0A853F6U6_9GAMM|nr:hypothetical protein [Candidatus Thiodubiliella endoseptemdiera]